MKWKKIIASLLCIGYCLGAFVACKKSSDSNDNSMEVIESLEKEENVTLQLSATEISNMSIGDSQYLVANYTEISGQTIEWIVSTPDVITLKKVDEETCEIIANRIGNAVITAKYATYTQTCQVTVSQNNLYPSLHLNTGVEGSVNVLKGDKLDLSCFVRYNGKVFEDVSLNYAVKDTTLGIIDNSKKVFTAAEKTGATEITITGTWRDIPSELLTKTITVNVISETVVVVNDGTLADIELMTVGEFEGKNYQNQQVISSVEVYIDGELFTDYTTAITDSVALDGTNNPVAILNNNIIKANAYGTAKFTVFVGANYSVSYDITVSRPLEKYGKTIKEFSTLDGELPTAEIFSNAQGEKEIFFAYQDKYALTVTDGKVLGVQSSQTEMSVETLIVYNDKVGYILEVEAYAKVLKTADDFMGLFDVTATSDEPVTLTGYFEMQNDILIDRSFQYWGRNRTFAGVFNGKGNKLTVPMRSEGVFGSVAGSIKNTWFEFTNVYDKGSYDTNVLLANFCDSCKELSNLYITIDESSFEKKDAYHAISLVNVISNNTKMENIIVDYGDLLPSNYSYSMYGLLAQRFNSPKDLAKYHEVYFISSTLKHLVVRKTPGLLYYVYVSNDSALMDVDKTACEAADISQYMMSGIARYDSWADLAEADIALSSFDESYWDTTSGVPQWKGEYVECAINGNVGTTATLSNNANSAYKSATVSITYNQVTLPLTLTVVEGDDFVTIDGMTVTAKANVLGTAIIATTFRLPGENMDRVKYFIFEVTYDIFEGEMQWSSGNNKMYLPNGLLAADEELATVIDLDTGEVLYANGVWNTAVLNNTNSEIQTFRAALTGDKGSSWQIQLSSYAYVFSTAAEISGIFSVAEKTTLTGYYLLVNNITVDNWTNNGSKLTFAGVFDGNGYKLTVPMRAYGLFGTLQGQVKNTWFEFTHVRAVDQWNNANNLLMQTAQKQFKVDGVLCNTLENLYITIDKATFNKNLDGTASTLEFETFSLAEVIDVTIKMQNVIVDYADLLDVKFNSHHGLLAQRYSSTGSEYWKAMPNFTNIYFISSKLDRLSKWSSTVVSYAKNDADKTLDGMTNTYRATDIYRYDDWTAFDKAEKLDKEGNNIKLSNFDSEFWTIEDNTIRWKIK